MLGRSKFSNGNRASFLNGFASWQAEGHNHRCDAVSRAILRFERRASRRFHRSMVISGVFTSSFAVALITTRTCRGRCCSDDAASCPVSLLLGSRWSCCSIDMALMMDCSTRRRGGSCYRISTRNVSAWWCATLFKNLVALHDNRSHFTTKVLYCHPII